MEAASVRRNVWAALDILSLRDHVFVKMTDGKGTFMRVRFLTQLTLLALFSAGPFFMPAAVRADSDDLDNVDNGDNVRQDGRDDRQDARQDGRDDRQDVRDDGSDARQDAREGAREGRQGAREGARGLRRNAR
jgi:hypothetical protein